jgi:hypothetical protein
VSEKLLASQEGFCFMHVSYFLQLLRIIKYPLQLYWCVLFETKCESGLPSRLTWK